MLSNQSLVLSMILLCRVGALSLLGSWNEHPTSQPPFPAVNRRLAIQHYVVSASTLLLAGTPLVSNAAYIDAVTNEPKITKRAYLDVLIGGKESGRLVIDLYGDLMPRAVENFATLCESNSYAGTTFYRVLSDFSIQGGAIGDPSGKTGKSAFEGGKPFEPDNFNLRHNRVGLVSAVRGIGGAIDSRFYIQCAEDGGWGDDRYAAFGRVEEQSMNLVKRIEKVDVQPPKNNPKKEVKILSSGILSD